MTNSGKNDISWETWYSRQIILREIGKEGQKKLQKARVAIAGVGGLGTWIAELCTRMGVGFIRVIDRDIVEPTNLHRTALFNASHVDLPKAEVAAEVLSTLNPHVKVEASTANIDETTMDDLFSDADLIIDGLDNFRARRVLNQASRKYEIPLVFGGALGTSGNVTTFSGKPKDPCLECLYGAVNDENLPTCETMGVHPAILSIIASIQVAEASALLIKGQGNFIGRLLFVDLTRMNFDVVEYKQSTHCPLCNPEAAPPKEARTLVQSIQEETTHREDHLPLGQVTELCGTNNFAVRPKKRIYINVEESLKKLRHLYPNIRRLGRLGLKFQVNDGMVDVFLFHRGNATIRGPLSPKEVSKLYHDIMKHVIYEEAK